MAASTIHEIDLPWGVPVKVAAGTLTLVDVGIHGGRARVETHEAARIRSRLQRENSRRLRGSVLTECGREGTPESPPEEREGPG